ncbi:hypothetical protein D3C86_1781170 [compost metagenome]
MGSYRKDVSLLGEKQNYYLSYQALHAREVYFEPVLHSKFVVRSVGPQEKKKGNYATFTYPDGSVENVARATPRFQKLQAIRVAAESQ